MNELYLETQHRAMIEQLLQEYLPDETVWCFGSRVHGRGLQRFSDLDLVVQSSEEISKKIGKLQDAFEASDLPIKVDLSQWNLLPEWLKQDILEEHVVLRAIALCGIEFSMRNN